MGKIRKVLAQEKIEPRYITADKIWGDLCEDIHLHYRNIRFDFSALEWANFRAAINHIGMGLEYTIEKYDYKEGDPNFLVSVYYNTPVSTDTKYYPNRVVVEFQRDNTVHFHYRDVRLHWTLPEFLQIARMFTEALEKYHNLKEFPFKDVKEKTRVKVPIDDIQPYDPGHLPLEPDRWENHTAGIEYVKKLIKEGKKIRPILVATNGQRLDGFKRYMAFKELGYKEIECIIDPFGKAGGQHNQSMLEDEL